MHLWLKAFHLIAVIAWFAGLFYMFRLFVNHVDHIDKPDVVEALIGMAERLYRIIMTPAMIASWVFGLAMLVHTPAYLGMPWLLSKLAMVAALTGYHFYTNQVRKRFAAGDVYLTSRQCRMRNEIPTLFLFAIVLLAVLRPGS